MPSKNFFDKGKKFIASGLAALFIGTGIGCKEDQIQTDSLKRSQEIWKIQKDLVEKQKAKKIIDSGNIQVDYIIENVVKNGTGKDVDLNKLRIAEEKSIFEPDEIFLIKPGKTYIKGKLRMGAYDTSTSKFYEINQVVNYEENPTPLWVYNEINQSQNVNTDARFIIAFINDGINPAEVLDIKDNDDFLALMNEPVNEKKIPGVYNIINLYNGAVERKYEGFNNIAEKPENILSFNFIEGNDSVSDLLKTKAGLEEISNIKMRIRNAAQKK